MSDTTQPRGTVYFERKLNDGNYGAVTAGIYLQFDQEGDVRAAAEATYEQAKTLVGAALEGVVPAATVDAVAAQTGGTVAAAPVQGGGADGVTSLGKGKVSLASACSCGKNEFWDNRPKKASGQYKSNAPDFKCADRACGEGVWQ